MEQPEVSLDSLCAPAVECRTVGVSPGGVHHLRWSGPALVYAVECGAGDRGAADVVTACVDELLAVGAVPVELSATIHGPESVVEDLTLGLERGCRAHGFVWRGGAWSAGPLPRVELDAVGRVVAALPGACAGDAIWACGSASLQDAGFDLAHAWLKARAQLEVALPGAEVTGKQALLTQRTAYYGPVACLLHESRLHAVIPMGIGGLTRSLRAGLPPPLGADLDLSSWPLPELAAWLRAHGGLDDAALAATFNVGLGQFLCVAPAQEDQVVAMLQAWNEPHWRVGRVTDGGGGVRLSGRLQAPGA